MIFHNIIALAATLLLVGDCRAWIHGNPGPHLTINLIFDQSVTTNNAPAAFTIAMNTCAANIAALVYSSQTINIDVGYGDMNGSPSAPGGVPVSGDASNYPSPTFNTIYSDLKPALVAAAKSPNALAAVATLPSSDPSPGGLSIYKISQILAFHLGLPGSTSQGPQTAWIGFNTSVTWNYTGNPSGSEKDIIGACYHELTEAMGRIGWQDNINHIFGVPDLYRYSAAATRQWAGGTGYFSINSGTTNLHTFSAGTGIDTADWSGVEGADSCNLNFTTGVVQPFSTPDKIMLDILGWSSQ